MPRALDHPEVPIMLGAYLGTEYILPQPREIRPALSHVPFQRRHVNCTVSCMCGRKAGRPV